MSDDLAYRLGFLCVPKGRAPEVVSQWHRLALAGQDLFVHPESTVQSTVTERGDTAIAIGDIFVAHGMRPLDDLLLGIAGGDRRPLEDLSGRFALFVMTAGEAVVLHDPLGSQALFYARSGGIAGSHSALVAEALGAAQSRRVRQYMALPEYKARKTRFLPGDLTLFDEVALLPPNNEIHLRSARTSRYWPIHPSGASSREEVFATWDEYFTNYARFLAPRYNPVLGLTGGIDSRSVIASLRSKGIDLRCETWDSMPTRERDRIDPMVEHLRVDHRWLDLSHRVDSTRFHELRSAAKKAAGFTRGTPLLPALMDDRAGARDVFLYGHGSGVMRGSYSRLFKPWLPEDPLKRIYALYAGPKRKDASREYEKFTLEALKGFLDRANYGAELHGADIGDLFYWEQRMANWAALQIATFSVAMQSHAALNSRQLFLTFWGIAGEARSAKEINKDVLRHYDPVLAEL